MGERIVHLDRLTSREVGENAFLLLKCATLRAIIKQTLWLRAARVLEGRGERIQESVLAEPAAEALKGMAKRLRPLSDQNTDSIICALRASWVKAVSDTKVAEPL